MGYMGSCLGKYREVPFRFLCRDAGGDSERMLLNETVPQWVVDITVDVSIHGVHGKLFGVV